MSGGAARALSVRARACCHAAMLIPGWILATCSAALFQTWRTALQQRLRGQLSLNAAAVVR